MKLENVRNQFSSHYTNAYYCLFLSLVAIHTRTTVSSSPLSLYTHVLLSLPLPGRYTHVYNCLFLSPVAIHTRTTVSSSPLSLYTRVLLGLPLPGRFTHVYNCLFLSRSLYTRVLLSLPLPGRYTHAYYCLFLSLVAIHTRTTVSSSPWSLHTVTHAFCWVFPFHSSRIESFPIEQRYQKGCRRSELFLSSLCLILPRLSDIKGEKQVQIFKVSPNFTNYLLVTSHMRKECESGYRYE